MDTVIKATCGILIAVVLAQVISKQGKDISLLLIVAVCCMVMTAAAAFIEPVLDFFQHLQLLGQLNGGLMKTLLKAVGIGVLTELTVLICSDMGHAALGKSLQLLATVSILWLSLPLFEELLQLLESVLEAV